MVRLIRRKPKDSGLAPGTLVFTGEQRVEEVRITLIDYDAGRVKRRAESALVSPETDVYLRDLYDHTIQVMDSVETYRDMISGMLDVYPSSISNKTNEIMKVLTLIATIFIPLTFVAGVYGMNFNFMPELQWRWGYPLVVGVMAATAVGLVFYFRRKGWL